jgi:branched-chain amino acid transport system substrate-binding protein
LAVVAAIAAACTSKNSSTSGGETTAPSGDTITIAVEGPMTGSQSATGIDMYNAAQLAVDQANKQGGVEGKQVELQRLDDAADAATGLTVANQAVANKDFAVIGPYNSSVGIENLPIYLKGGVIPIHLTSSHLTDGMGYTVQPKDYQVAPIEAAAINGFFKAKRVAIVFDISEYTAGIAKQLQTELKKDGADVVFVRRFNEKNLVPGLVVHQIAQAKPDLFYSSTYFPQGAAIAKAAAEQGLKAMCFMGLANQDPEFVARAGQKAASKCALSGVPSPEQFPAAAQYVTDYKARWHTDPGTWGTFTYDSVNLLFDAVHRAGGWDSAAVKTQLTGTKNFEGTTGTISIDAKTGNRLDVPIVLLQIDPNGSIVVNPNWEKFAGFESG